MNASQTHSSVQGLPQSVLLVEDNAVIAMNTESLLQDLGIAEVQIAGNVADAMSLIDRSRFDLAILDLKLGNEDSLPIAERLRTQGVPVVFATGFGEEIDLPAGQGDPRILKKPYSFEDLEQLFQSN